MAPTTGTKVPVSPKPPTAAVTNPTPSKGQRNETKIDGYAKNQSAAIADQRANEQKQAKNAIKEARLEPVVSKGTNVVKVSVSSDRGKVDEPNLGTALFGSTTGADTVAGGYVAGAGSAVYSRIGNAIYHSPVSNSSSKVESYRKLLALANKADPYKSAATKLTGMGAKSVGTKLGVAGAVLGGGAQIWDDCHNEDYSDDDKEKAVFVDVVQMGASVGAVIAVSMFVPGIGWGIAAGIGLGMLINYGAQMAKDRLIDHGK